MTWAVGATSIFGSAFVASDIQVSWPNGFQRDCLQKVTPWATILLVASLGQSKLDFV